MKAPPKSPTRTSTRIKIQAADIKSPRERKPVIAKKKTTPKRKAASAAVKKAPTPATKTTPKRKATTTPKKKTPSSSSAKKAGTRTPGNPSVYEGKPQAKLPNGATWPTGWIEKHFERQSGTTANTFDRYWYPPKTDYKLRSLKDVVRYMEAYAKTKNAEKAMQAVADKKATTTPLTKKSPAAKKKAASPVKRKSTSPKKRSSATKKRSNATPKKTTPEDAKGTPRSV